MPLADGRIGMWTAAGTGKWKRLRANPRITLQRCSARGAVKPGTPVYGGTARILEPGFEADDIRARITRRYGAQIRLMTIIRRLQARRRPVRHFGDTIIVIALDPTSPR